MKKSKHKIVVFTDLKKSIDNTLKSAISLAKIVNADIELFHVTKASEVVNMESQLSVIRNINNDYITVDNTMKNIVKAYSQESSVHISHTYAIGRPKHEIDKYIKEKKPDIVVLRKKKTKLLGLLGNSITKMVLESYSGTIFMADDNHVLDLNKKISLAILNDNGKRQEIDFADNLFSHSDGPLKSFKIVADSNNITPSESYYGKKTIEYVFEKRDHTIKSLSTYITLSNINLLCLDRAENNPNNRNKNGIGNSNIKEIINALNVPLLLTGKPKYTI
ncbi:universal stress protein [Maribacter sp. CXY002]|uniref:universal stress protein n=1 Tax=Maribacter luteocoastalis TaxID=3407671 RepID=UPI003B6785F5